MPEMDIQESKTPMTPVSSEVPPKPGRRAFTREHKMRIVREAAACRKTGAEVTGELLDAKKLRGPMMRRYLVAEFVDHYNNACLHCAIGYVAPAAVLEGRADAIRAECQLKIREARLRRKRETPLTGKEADHTLHPVVPAESPAEAVAPLPLVVTCSNRLVVGFRVRKHLHSKEMSSDQNI